MKPPALPDLATIARVPAMIEWLSGLSRGRAWAVSVTGLTLVIAIDYLTPAEYSFGVFYMLPICVAVWAIGQGAGLLIGMVGVAVGIWLSTSSAGLLYGRPAGATVVWNGMMRLLAVLLIVVLVDGFRKWFDVARHRAERDELTGLLNRRAFSDRMHATLALARRRREWVALLYIDLDGFKKVNDLFGHGAGDLVLIGFAKAMTGTVRQSDHVARIGGDEFVILMPISSERSGFQACERLYADLTAAVVTMPYPLTCSAGAVVMEAQYCDDHDTLIALADKSMYEGKRAGRNNLRFARADIGLSTNLRDAFPVQANDLFEEILHKIK